MGMVTCRACLLRAVLTPASFSLEHNPNTSLEHLCAESLRSSTCSKCGMELAIFRKKDLWLALLFYVPYVLAALALAIALFRTSNPLALWYCTYVGYLAYVTWWSFQVWRPWNLPLSCSSFIRTSPLKTGRTSCVLLVRRERPVFGVRLIKLSSRA